MKAAPILLALAMLAAGPSKAADAASAPTLPAYSDEPVHTGAATFNLGDRFTGPGVLTFGWLGSKKQLSLPPGDWVVLAAVDHDYSPGKTTTVQLVTVVMGQFRGAQLASTLRVTGNRRAGKAGDITWTDLERCRSRQPNKRLWGHGTARGETPEGCAEVLRVADTRPEDMGSAAAEVTASLARLQVRPVAGPAFLSHFYATDHADGFLRVVRTDWVAADADFHPYAAWAEAYEPLVVKGLAKSVDLDDLAPLKRPAVAAVPDNALDPAAMRSLR